MTRHDETDTKRMLHSKYIGLCLSGSLSFWKKMHHSILMHHSNIIAFTVIWVNVCKKPSNGIFCYSFNMNMPDIFEPKTFTIQYPLANMLEVLWMIVFHPLGKTIENVLQYQEHLIYSFNHKIHSKWCFCPWDLNNNSAFFNEWSLTLLSRQQSTILLLKGKVTFLFIIYTQTSSICRTLARICRTLADNKVVDHSHAVGAAPTNYIFILDLTPNINGLGKCNCKTRR